jgi:16S rRNA (guanine966-N2)-methyltransferase
MRITSGTAGGIPLKVPDAVTRPTTDRVRQAIFNMLGEVVADARVLDLFAGSGALGLEALSRGASRALLVDEHRGACAIIQENLAKAKLRGCLVRQGDVYRVLAELAKTQAGGFDLIFADPPYAHGPKDPDLGAKLLQCEALGQAMAPGGSLILECRMTNGAFSPPSGWRVERDREYGSTRVLWLRKIADVVPIP